MATLLLEERVAALEAEVARLKRSIEVSASSARPWWKRVAGTFADDPTFEEAMQLGHQYRESQRPRTGRSRKG